MQASGTLGDKVTVLWGSQGVDFPSLATARYVVSVLDQLGYRASLRTVSPLNYFSVLGDSRDGVQAGFFSWYQDYPSPSDFIDPLLTCSSFLRPARTTSMTPSSAIRRSTPRLSKH